MEPFVIAHRIQWNSMHNAYILIDLITLQQGWGTYASRAIYGKEKKGRVGTHLGGKGEHVGAVERGRAEWVPTLVARESMLEL